jgi:hypothetical protein
VSPLSILLPGETPNTQEPTDDGGAPPPIDGDFVYGRRPVIDVGAGLYNNAEVLSMELSTVTPTTIVSDVEYESYSRLIAKDCSMSDLGSTTYAPVSVLSFTSCAEFPDTDEWYRPAEYGWYLMKQNVRSMKAASNQTFKWWWETLYATEHMKGSAGFGGATSIFCRYNPPSGGLSPHVPGTYDDPEFQEPGAVLIRGNSLELSHPLGPPTEDTWYWCKFYKGGPADFPPGQRFRCVSETDYANGAIKNSTNIFPVDGIDGGLYHLWFTSPGWDGEPPYPWPATIPWPVPGAPDPGETDGSIEDTNIFKLYFKIRFTKV